MSLAGGAQRRIFVMGGGGFAMEPDNLLLDRYILSLSDRRTPKICFIGTASGDSERYINNFYAAYGTLDCTPSHLSLFKPPTKDLESFVAEQDVIHVGGGNTKNLLCLWREWSLDQILRRAYERGTLLSGMSAGMLCWFEEGVTDSYGDGLEPLKCLGFLQGSACPHFDGEAERKPAYIQMLRSGAVLGGIALDDGAGALFVNEKRAECVTSRVSAGAYSFEAQTAKEARLSIKHLGE